MNEKLKDILENLTAAYDATEGVPASGQALDRLAQARQSLRMAYGTAKTLLKEAETDG